MFMGVGGLYLVCYVSDEEVFGVIVLRWWAEKVVAYEVYLAKVVSEDADTNSGVNNVL